jgi:hypothetical protein
MKSYLKIPFSAQAFFARWDMQAVIQDRMTKGPGHARLFRAGIVRRFLRGDSPTP